ncbi:TPA: hypothetical protein ACH3X1_008606 [Trebouxia sp. C0004]
MSTAACCTLPSPLSLTSDHLHYWGNGSIRLQSPPLPMKMMKGLTLSPNFRLSPIRQSPGAATLSARALWMPSDLLAGQSLYSASSSSSSSSAWWFLLHPYSCSGSTSDVPRLVTCTVLASQWAKLHAECLFDSFKYLGLQFSRIGPSL